MKNSSDYLSIRPFGVVGAGLLGDLPRAPAQGIGRCRPQAAMAPHGGIWGLSFASLLRFCAVAARRNSSLAPHGPRSLKRAIRRMRFRCAKSARRALYH
ncbi:hypothetical protein AGR8A_pTi10142 [Agrobacterium fabrum str. J-07]|nr:hypothetical protein AGR8A_pTi10142 [Agrobacterium fabrum str. J-07]